MYTNHAYCRYNYLLTILGFTLFFSTGLCKAQEIIFVNDDANGANTGLSWNDAFTDLQKALSEAEYGDEIWVASGIYKPTKCNPCTEDQKSIFFDIKSGVRLYGGFKGHELEITERQTDSVNLFSLNNTVLSGNVGIETDSTDNSFTVVRMLNCDSTTSINGFTISSANSPLYEVANNNPMVSGGGLILDRSSAKVQNCLFSKNTAAYSGGGIYCHYDSSSISNCFFNNNFARQGAGIHSFWSEINISNCNFSQNISEHFTAGQGAGIAGNNSNLTIQNVIFQDNQVNGNGGAVYIAGGFSKISNCNFTNNRSNINGGVRWSDLAGQFIPKIICFQIS
ncbi:MAG: hypothetical protein AAF655_17015 [Bacteroidota bacterium]